MDMAEKLYISGFIALEIFTIALPIVSRRFLGVHGEAWAFFPLMLRSVYCAVGLMWAYIRLSTLYIMQKP
jgi:alpha-1,3-glucosyltransferase